ncbi:hypothetical protein RHSIM_Rhsim06G0076100 [Rhododendron simsii]|uniref:Protein DETOXIFICATION n=1 Tax=Rhododendron simsii TaxID=118357 RepID=A0A834LN98_RHOSS|nr:hypothetical protein RHSIM_Rhsim06G0076100 [Rhododendron simsii]
MSRASSSQAPAKPWHRPSESQIHFSYFVSKEASNYCDDVLSKKDAFLGYDDVYPEMVREFLLSLMATSPLKRKFPIDYRTELNSSAQIHDLNAKYFPRTIPEPRYPPIEPAFSPIHLPEEYNPPWNQNVAHDHSSHGSPLRASSPPVASNPPAMDLLGLLTQQYQGLTYCLDHFGGRLDAIDTKFETIDQYHSLFVELFANFQEMSPLCQAMCSNWRISSIWSFLHLRMTMMTWSKLVLMPLMRMLSDSLENWYYRILIVMTGNLKDATLAVDALSICMSINGWEMMIPLAFFAGTGVRVANELGAGNAKAARFATIVSVVQSTIIGLFFCALIMMLHRQIALIFTSSTDVLDAVDSLSLLLAITILLNSIQPILSGVAVGSGWQSKVAYLNLGCYYLVGVPLGVVLGWVFDLGVKGIWGGMIFGGTAVQTVILAIIVMVCNWEKEAENATMRIQKWSAPNTDSES